MNLEEFNKYKFIVDVKYGNKIIIYKDYIGDEKYFYDYIKMNLIRYIKAEMLIDFIYDYKKSLKSTKVYDTINKWRKNTISCIMKYWTTFGLKNIDQQN